jgi:two-component system cell cycle response regulator
VNPATSARVLVIEDDPASAALMDYLLRSSGYRTMAAGDGLSGVALAQRERPDLVLCDIQMPGIDGFEVACRLRQIDALRDVPLVALTAMAMIGDRNRILERGFDAYLAKPIDPQALLALVRQQLHEAAGVEAAAPVRPAPDRAAAPSWLATVLAVDDIHFNLELKRRLLEPHGYRVLTADTMHEALALARRFRPDLIVSDVGMKNGNGFDFITALKADPALSPIPVLFLSSTHWDEPSRARGLALGAAGYLRRPLDSQLLLDEIRALLQR